MSKKKEVYENFKKIKRQVDGYAEPIPSLKEYITEQLNSERAELSGEVSLSIGTDSKFHPRRGGWSVTYATILAFTFKNRGTHLIARKEVKTGTGHLSLFDRLWTETEMTVMLAVWIRDEFGIESEVHLDVNPKKSEGSNIIYETAVGYAASMGFHVEAKPSSPVAMCAADHLVRNKLVA